MGLRLICAVLCAVVLAANSAPTSLTSSTNGESSAAVAAASASAEKPLIRTKRAEEILYGNHQNAPRVKKADPAAAAAAADDNDSRIKDAAAIKDDETKNDEDHEAATPGGDGKENQVEAGDEQPAPLNDQDERPLIGDSHGVEDVPTESDEADYQRYDGQEESENEAESLRKKRSINSALMTAENMLVGRRNSVMRRPARAKRDLDYEDLRRIIEASREDPYEVEEEKEEEDGPERVFGVVPESEGEGGEAEEDEDESPVAVALPYEYGSRYEGQGPSEKEELLRELVEKKVEEDAKEKLLDYLLATALASETESTEGEEDPAADDDGEEEGGEEEDFAEGPGREDYEDISRSIVSAPVALKRSDFYPYSYEPYGGRWGAMVPGAKRSSSNDYERLYRLAEALNADDDYEEE